MEQTALSKLYTVKGLYAGVREDVMGTMSMEEWLDIESDKGVDDVVEGYYLTHLEDYTKMFG
jgi:hypothetical protein